MDKIKAMEQYELWVRKAKWDSDIIQELLEMQIDKNQIEDAFYRDLRFGTGGLRGVIGAGTNRMNIHVVARASQGLANYVKRHVAADKRRIAIGYDSRIKSDLFAKIVAGVFAANNIEVFIYSELMPTPCLSFAVRKLNCAAGVMITASHNPAKYNGYKVYGADGGQITTSAAKEIEAEIGKLDFFEDIQYINYDLASDTIHNISEDIYTAFINEVRNQSLLGEQDYIDKKIKIVYSPLNGTGLKPVCRVLKEVGYENVFIVKEQQKPDGHFTTCPNPNPELRETMALGIEYARQYNAELFLATDPDCDRVGVAVRNSQGEFVLLSGNEIGLLLMDYICARRVKLNKMPSNPIVVKTIVTTDMAERIAAYYGVQIINVLTGFKYIGEHIGMLEDIGKETSYIFGFEESYGYLSGTYARDKDAVGGCFLICEMLAYYRGKGSNLLEKLEELYGRYGFWLNTLHSYEFEGASGFYRMQKIMDKFRDDILAIGTKRVELRIDYAEGIDGLPKSDVIKYQLEDNCSMVIRPSGTEPKLKVYISVSASSREEASGLEGDIAKSLEHYIKNME